MKGVSLRYAKALYSIAGDGVLSELQVLEKIFKDKQVQRFLHSPLVRDSDKEVVLKRSLKGIGLDKKVYNFVLTVARKGRIPFFSQILLAFQKTMDEVYQIHRGEVISFQVLSSEERQKVQKVVSDFIQRKVILTYREDPHLMGGLVAKVGSYTFDDTLTSHLRRLNENLKRRTY